MVSWAQRLLKWRSITSASNTAWLVSVSSATLSIQQRSSLITSRPVPRTWVTSVGHTSSRWSSSALSRKQKSKKIHLTIEITQFMSSKCSSTVKSNGSSDSSTELSVNCTSPWSTNIQAFSSHKAVFNLHRKTLMTTRMHPTESQCQAVVAAQSNHQTCLEIVWIFFNPTCKTSWWSQRSKSPTSWKPSLVLKSTSQNFITITWIKCNMTYRRMHPTSSSASTWRISQQTKIKFKHLIKKRTRMNFSSSSQVGQACSSLANINAVQQMGLCRNREPT